MGKSAMIGRLEKFNEWISSSVKVICIILLMAIVTTVCVSVFTRFVIFHPLNFADALVKYMMMWMAFLGAGLAVHASEHIAVDMLVSKFSVKARKVIIVISNILISVFLLVVIYFGFVNAWSGRDVHDPFVFNISMMIPYLSVPVGAFYMLIQTNLVTIIQLFGEEQNQPKEIVML